LEKNEEKLKRNKEKEEGEQEPTPAVSVPSQEQAKTDDTSSARSTSTEAAPTPGNASTRSPTTKKEESTSIGSTSPRKQTNSDKAPLTHSAATQTPVIADTPTRQAKIVNCSAPGVDLKRRLETYYDDYPAELPCRVVYYKEDGTTQLIAKSRNTPGYCANKREEFLEKLNGWGWQCKE
jgi:hypothetical protein